MKNLTGSNLGSYRLVARLHRSDHVELYKGYHPELYEYVAVKIRHNALLDSQEYARRLEHEATALGQLSHPNIVHVYDFAVSDDTPYLVMEFVEGPTLADELAARRSLKQPFEINEAVYVFNVLLSAMEHIHQQGMVHRNLEPAGLIFTTEGQVILTDFHMAHLVNQSGTAENFWPHTSAYLAPEQRAGQIGDERSDIYALGVILYEMLTAHDVNAQPEADTWPRLTDIYPDLPVPLADLFHKATHPDPGLRHQSVQALETDLRAVVNQFGTQPLTPRFVKTLALPPQDENEIIVPGGENFRTQPGFCPYRGLFAFREEDAYFFFGREAVVEQLLATVAKQSLVAVVGPSGSGKSSVVHAGLLPPLRAKNEWLIATCRLGAQPFRALVRALIPWLDASVDEEKLVKELRNGTAHLVEVIAQIVSQQQVTRFLLVVDQFEELYTLVTDAGVRRRFLDTLLSARSHTLIVVLTIRADFMGQALTYRPLADALQTADLKLGPMNRQELGRAIENPAARQGIGFETGLVERILNDVGDEPGNLPLLEFALTLLWEHKNHGMLTHAAYEALGRVDGALARYADEVYQRLPHADKRTAQQIFMQLVTPGEGTDDTRRLATRRELGEKRWPLVQRLADARLVITGRGPTGEQTVEIVHETLIRTWKLFQMWINSGRAFRVWQEQMRGRLRQWEENDQDTGALLRGIPLAEAERWLVDHRESLTEAERNFIQTSIAFREQERASREQARQRVIVGLGVGLALAVVLMILAGVGWWRAETQRQLAITAQATAAAERDRADAQTQLALGRLAFQLAERAIPLLETRPDLGLLLSVEAYQTAPIFEAHNSLLTALEGNPYLITWLREHNSRVRTVAYDPTGQYLASAGDNNAVILWDVAQQAPVGTPLDGHTGWISDLAFSPDGQLLASASRDETIILWDVETGQPLGEPLAGHTSWISGLAFNPDGQLLASASGDETIILWDVATRQPLGDPLAGHTDWVADVAFSPDGQLLASGSGDRSIILWDVATRQPLGDPLKQHTGSVISVAFNPTGDLIASGSADSTLRLWDVATGEPRGGVLAGHQGLVRAIAFSPDGRLLASAGADHTVQIWDVDRRLRQFSPFVAHIGPVFDLAFSPDGQTLVSASEDTTLILWDLTASQSLGHPLTGHQGEVGAVAFSPDGRLLASASDDASVILWDVAERASLDMPLEHAAAVNAVAFSPDGTLLATGSVDRLVYLWDVAARHPLGNPLSGHTSPVEAVAFSPDGTQLASGGTDSTVYLWNVGTRTASPLQGHSAAVSDVAFSPDGLWLASASVDGSIILWEVATGQPSGEPLIGHDFSVQSVAFSPDGHLLVSTSEDASMVIWDVATQQPLATPPARHTDLVSDAAFSPDGRILVTSGLDAHIVLWDVATQMPYSVPLLAGTPVNSLDFNGDGALLASGGRNGTVIVWELGIDTLQQRVCEIVQRNLTRDEWRVYFGTEPYRATCPGSEPE